MKLSTKAQYGLKACFYLARNYGGGKLSVSRLSELANVSVSYLEQLMIPLKKAGIIEAERGANGGYSLTAPPEAVTAGMIVRPLEDNLEIVDCLSGGCREETVCPTCAIWERLYNGINDLLDSITLRQMLDDYRAKMKGDQI